MMKKLFASQVYLRLPQVCMAQPLHIARSERRPHRVDAARQRRSDLFQRGCQ